MWGGAPHAHTRAMTDREFLPPPGAEAEPRRLSRRHDPGTAELRRAHHRTGSRRLRRLVGR